MRILINGRHHGMHFPRQVAVQQMVSVQYGDIPTYLHKSAFYLGLHGEDQDDMIEVPANCLWLDSAIHTYSQFRVYVQTLQFWGTDYLTIDGIEFCFSRERGAYAVHLRKCIKIIADVCSEQSTLHKELYSLFAEIDASYKEEYWHIEEGFSFSEGTLAADILPRLKTIDIGTIVCGYMARKGRLEDLVTVHEGDEEGDLWNERTCAHAAFGGHKDCLQYLLENDCPCDPATCAAAAHGGHLDILQYLHDENMVRSQEITRPDVRTPHAMEMAVQSGNIGCVQFLHKLNYPWSAMACEIACNFGYFEILQYLHDNGCPWDEQCFVYAIFENHDTILEYLSSQNCPCGSKTYVEAAGEGKLALMQFLHEHEVPWQAEAGDLSPADRAAQKGQIDTLRFAMEHGCPYSDHIASYAIDADTNNLVCLIFLIEEQALSMDESVFAAAFRHADFVCMEYLFDLGCPIQTFKCSEFRNTDRNMCFKCLEYVITRGWNVDPKFVRVIERYADEYELCYEYLETEGLLLDDTVK